MSALGHKRTSAGISPNAQLVQKYRRVEYDDWIAQACHTEEAWATSFGQTVTSSLLRHWTMIGVESVLSPADRIELHRRASLLSNRLRSVHRVRLRSLLAASPTSLVRSPARRRTGSRRLPASNRMKRQRRRSAKTNCWMLSPRPKVSTTNGNARP
jgi:hypothetical protein